jgi:hypothetical protein
MPALKNVSLGIRAQAAGILTLMTVWFFSAYRGPLSAYSGRWGALWAFVFTTFPIIAGFFAVVLAIEYFQFGRPHPWWVRVAIASAITPWLILLSGWVLD